MNRAISLGGLLATSLLAATLGILPADLYAAQRSFASADEAAKALQAAVQTKDKTSLGEIFGPQVQGLLTGDEVQDQNNEQRFAAAMAQGYTLVKEGEDKITLEVGTNNWPMPVPLVKTKGYWYFDTAAGKEEIINRHIGKDELHAIGVCRAYVAAQRHYAGAKLPGEKGGKYALKFKSTLGKKDGLYWPSTEDEKASPFGPLVAEANADGHFRNKGMGPQPFHGYYFKILTRQGKEAPGGKMDYMSHGDLARGFALVAYPADWGRSGIMTFIVNQDSQVFQRNFGEKTLRIAGAMKEYNPGKEWTLVQDEGVWSAVSDK